MLNAESLLKPAKPPQPKKRGKAKRVTALIDKSIADLLICSCGPAVGKVISRFGGDPYTGDYELTDEKVRCQVMNSDEINQMIKSSPYRVTELAERSILAYCGGM